MLKVIPKEFEKMISGVFKVNPISQGVNSLQPVFIWDTFRILEANIRHYCMGDVLPRLSNGVFEMEYWAVREFSGEENVG